MASIVDKWGITSGPGRWDFIIDGLTRQQPCAFTISTLNHPRSVIVRARIVQLGPDPNDTPVLIGSEACDAWRVLLYFVNGPLRNMEVWYSYDTKTRVGHHANPPR